jgi:hypothetical protein
MASPTQMHNVLCRSVTIEARFTASSRSSGSHRDWNDLYRASNSRVEERCGRRCMYRMQLCVLQLIQPFKGSP